MSGGAFESHQDGASAVLLSKFTTKELLQPCFEADNDSRYGAAAEAECEQYLRGFTDALTLSGLTEGKICLPDQNRDSEVRWAFMRWVHEKSEIRFLSDRCNVLLMKSIPDRLNRCYWFCR